VHAEILQYPEHFDNVERIKTELTHQPVLPGDNELWILGSPLIVDVDGLEQIDVPVGFTTDGASVPDIAQVFTGWHKWEDPQRYPAIVHDWLYCKPGVLKSRADAVFHALLRSEGANTFQATAMYLAVIVGGGWAYRTDQDNGPAIFV
jgi:hypothetical protein